MCRLAAILLYIVVSTNGQVFTSFTACTDGHVLCPFWASMGECGRNPAVMLANCQVSCDSSNKCTQKISAPVSCIDLNPSCAPWASQNQCSLNPYFMNWQCPRSCNPGCGAAPVAGTAGHAVAAPVAGTAGHAVAAPVAGTAGHAVAAPVAGTAGHAVAAPVAGTAGHAVAAPVAGTAGHAVAAPVAGTAGHAVAAPVAGTAGHAVAAPVAGTAGRAVAAPTSSTDKNNHQPWQDFKAQFGKMFADDPDEEQHFQQFLKSVEYIENNKDKYTHSLALNHLSDLTDAEMEDHMGYQPDEDTTGATTHLHPENMQVPAAVDWRQKGYVTPIKDQAHCGACFTFGTTGMLEGQMFRKTGKLVSLSEQNIIDCAPIPPLSKITAKNPNNGCSGGSVSKVLSWLQKYGGLNPDSSYPYDEKQTQTSRKQACKYNPNQKAAVVTGYVKVTGGEEGLRNATATIGPIAVAICAKPESFKHYKEGIYDDPECNQSPVAHIVLVVGYGTDASGKDYWIIKNQWATTWGIKGYMLMARNTGGDGMCHVAKAPTYALV